MTVFSWVQKRERGLAHGHGGKESVHRALYSTMGPFSTWNMPDGSSPYGGVYNLEFSPDGSMLVAACEKRAVVIFDPQTNEQTKVIRNAHQDCVNCVKFLDDRLFATCSDDSTIVLWDVRNLKTKLRTLNGHMNWVKNIEYSSKDGLLVTSGFDGSVFTWDINSYTEQGLTYQKVFHTSGLMRCRISPDANKLVISTTGGYMIIVHHLDLATLAVDLAGFRPNIYRLMQMGRQYIPYAASFDHIFAKTMKKNRVELVSDFPAKNDAEVISSLQIHPQGWCALSRNISYDESSEWTCVHDIQEWVVDDDDDEDKFKDEQNERDRSSSGTDSDEEGQLIKLRVKRAKLSKTTDKLSSRRNNRSNSSSQNRATDESSSRQNNRTVTSAQNRAEPVHDAGSSDIWAAETTIRDRNLYNRARNTFLYGFNSGVIEDQQASTQTNTVTATSSESHSKPSRQINQNMERMLKYIEEPNKGKGFIKELCFSSDGRIICSPYGNGVRLLAFSPDCSELPNTLNPNGEAQPLLPLKFVKCHSDIVVSTKFSPRQPLFVSGCLRGKVVWYQPNF